MIVLDGKYTLFIITDYKSEDGICEYQLKAPRTDLEKKSAKRYILLQAD